MKINANIGRIYVSGYNFNEIQNDFLCVYFQVTGKCFLLFSSIGVSQGKNINIHEL